MAHKHNRRRMRPRSRNTNNYTPAHPSIDRLLLSQSGLTTEAAPPAFEARKPQRTPSLPSHAPFRPADVSVKQWQNRYISWQNRDRAQREEAAKIEAAQIQLFGGEPGDDISLCYRMLEFFGGLDYIDP